VKRGKIRREKRRGKKLGARNDEEKNTFKNTMSIPSTRQQKVSVMN